ncbi:MAG: hypothetical protein H7839_01935 [Magnetococcus sp. YQC-5]
MSIFVNHANHYVRSLYKELTRPCFTKQPNSAIPNTAIISTILIIAGMHYLKLYYSYYNLFINNMDITLQEMIYTAITQFLIGATLPDWLFLVACLSLSLISATTLWAQTKLKYIIFLASILAWLIFGFYVDKMFIYMAKIHFFIDTTNTSDFFPRVTGTIGTNKTCDDETKSNLENGCYFLIMKDKQTYYLLLDPTINSKWTWEQKNEEDLYIRRKSFEICIKKYQSKKHNPEKIHTCSQNEYNNAKSKNIEHYVTEIQQSIKTVQIPTTSLGTLTTLPKGSPTNNACKRNPDISNLQNQSSVNAKL